MGNSTWDNLLDPFVTARGTSKSTFSTFQDIAGLTNRFDSLPQTIAKELKLGSKVALDARGEYTCLTSATVQLGFIYNATPNAAGGTTLAASGVITAGTTPTAWPWMLEYEGIVTSIGQAGANSVIYGHGSLKLGTSLTVFSETAIPITAAARQVSIDAGITALWGVGCAYGASSASNQVICDIFNARILNQGKPS
jgi:hypothetical protein